MARTIASPGVEVIEHDSSTYASTTVGTTVLLMGFSDKGPSDEILEISNFEEFEQIYGKPTNAAERYFYHSAKQIYSSNANVYASRLPYGADKGDGFGNKYGALFYPIASALSANNINEFDNQIKNGLSSIAVSSYTDSLSNLSAANYIEFGKPVHVDLTKYEYLAVLNSIQWKNSGQLDNGETLMSYDGLVITDINNQILQAINGVNSNVGNFGIIVLNESQTTINDQYEGYYLGMIDNKNLEPGSNYDGVISIDSINTNSSFDQTPTSAANYISLPDTRINFELSSLSGSNVDSISEVLEDIPTYNIYGPDFTDYISVGLFKVRQSVFSTDVIKLDYSLQEAYFGSMDYWRTMASPNGGSAQRIFIGNAINNDSNNINILVNDYITNKNSKSWLDINGKPTKIVRFNEAAKSLFPVGSYNSTIASTKAIGSIPDKIDRVFSKIDDPELFELDITVEAGLGTIWTYKLINEQRLTAGQDILSAVSAVSALPGYSDTFDDTIDVTNYITNNNNGGGFYNTGLTELTGSAHQIQTCYNTIINKFNTFASKMRKDHIFLADPMRFTCVKGTNTKVLQAVDVNNEPYNFSQHVYWPMRYQFMSTNTSYGATYANWGNVYDATMDNYIWIPCSATIASIIAYSSNIAYPWYAPAGFNRGTITSLDGVAIYPNQKQRDQLYKISLNPIAYFPNDGIVVYGQKTLQTKPSAFDRINVRRLFLYLERITQKTLKYFVFEPNNYFTRTQVLNTLDPIFNQVKTQQGMYSYRLVCSEANNIPTVIDNNELVVDIYIAPTKAAEYILANFYATRTNGVTTTETAS